MAKVLITPNQSYWEFSEAEGIIITEVTSALVKGRWHVPSFRIGSWDGHIRMFNPRNGTLPSGLAEDCCNALIQSGFSVAKEYQDCKQLEPRLGAEIYYDIKEEHQLRALEAMCSNKRGIVHAATNSGKTKIAQAWCAMNNLKTLYLVPSKELLTQTVESFKRDTNLSVGYVSADEGCQLGEDVTVVLVTSIAQRKNKNTRAILNQAAVDNFKKIAPTFQAVIVDECHHMVAETWKWTVKLLKNAHYRYGLSGTPWEQGNKEDELKVKSLLGPVIATVSNSELIQTGWSADPVIFMVPVKSLPIAERTDYDIVYDNGIVYNDLRNNMIVKIAEDLVKQNKSCLIISVRLAQCETLSNLLTMKSITHRVITGQSEKEERKNDFLDFRDCQFPVLISNVLSEGVDIPALNSLIFASGGKSSKKLLQRIGRGIRKKPVGDNTVEIYDFIDESHKKLMSHTRQRMKIYKSEDFKIIEHNIRF